MSTRVKSHLLPLGGRYWILLLLLSLLSCTPKSVTPNPEHPAIAYLFTRQDGTHCVIQYPAAQRTLDDIKRECGCEKQACTLEVIRFELKRNAQ